MEKVEFTSADQAWEDFKEEYFQGSDAAEGFRDDNPLVNSANLAVYMNQIEMQGELVSYIQDWITSAKWSSRRSGQYLGSFNRLVSYASLVIIVLLIVISVFLISNTISVGIAVRKEEIGIMKYIGATDGFVRAPFVLEGMILGLIGAAIPLTALYFLYNTAVEYVLTVSMYLPRGGIYSGDEYLPYPCSYQCGAGNRNRPDWKFLDYQKTLKSMIS